MQERQILFWVIFEGVASMRCEVTYSCVALWRHHQCHQIHFGVPCSEEDTELEDWKVSRRKQWEEIKKRENRLKELKLFGAAKRKPLCKPAVCQHVIVVIKVPDFHGSLIYWFVNLPGWFRLDVVKTSCYHHKTVARPPREARKPPSLGAVRDKRDDAGRTEPQVCCCPLVLVCRPPGLGRGARSCLARVWQGEQRKGTGMAGLVRWEEGAGLNGMEKSLWERVETHMVLGWVLGWTDVENAEILPSPQL